MSIINIISEVWGGSWTPVLDVMTPITQQRLTDGCDERWKIAPNAASSAPKCRKLTRMHAYTLIQSYGAVDGPRGWLVQYLIIIYCRRGVRWWKATSGVTAARHCGHTRRQRPKPTLNNDHMDYGEGVDAGVGRSAASMVPINGRRLSSEDFWTLDLSSEDFWSLALRRDIDQNIWSEGIS